MCVVGDSELSRDTTTFRNPSRTRAWQRCIFLVATRISFIGGSAADSPVGVQVDDGVFTDFTNNRYLQCPLRDLGSPQGGLSLNKCYGEAKDGGIYSATDSPERGPPRLSNCTPYPDATVTPSHRNSGKNLR